MIQIACLGVIRSKDGKVLSVEQKELDQYLAFFPGGKIEENESCKECVKRELEEEIGVQVRVKGLLGFSETKYKEKEMLNLYYETEIISGTPRIQESEKLKSLNYIEISEISNYSLITFLKQKI